MRVKLAATIGPASASDEVVEKLILEGCRIFRINFSHGSPELWRGWARRIREIAGKLGIEVVLLGDLKGPSIRLGVLPKPIHLAAGEEVSFARNPQDEREVPLPEQRVFQQLAAGDMIVTDDGRALLQVLEVNEDNARVRALTELVLSSRKSIVIRGKEFPVEELSSEDAEALKIAVEEDFDLLGMSFVSRARDLTLMREKINELGGELEIIAKIETPSAVANISEIVNAADAVLIARGDLGMYFSLEEVPKLQNKITQASLAVGKPVMVATQLLGSMVNAPVPTRSEVVDVVNSVREGVDVLLLTGETAVGRYPVEAIRWLRRIVESYESEVARQEYKLDSVLGDRFAMGVVSLAESLDATLAVYTKSGSMARRISRFRPKTRVYAATPSKKVLRKLNILWGIQPISVESHEYGEGLNELEKKLVELGLVSKGEALVLTYGLIDEPFHIVKIIQIT